MNNINYQVMANKIVFEKTSIEFEYPIAKSIEVSDMLVILLSVPPGKIYNENVFAINIIEKQIGWQIEKRNYYDKECPYTGIQLHGNRLSLFNWCSHTLIVDAKTGKVLEDHESR